MLPDEMIRNVFFLSISATKALMNSQIKKIKKSDPETD
jgi:hypothetical protein